MKKFDFTCPNCGSEFTVVETNETKQPKAVERIEALRKAGVDVSNMFAMVGANGNEFVAQNENGHLIILDDNSPIFAAIKEQGTVPNNRLFRRFVMAQTFRLLSRYYNSNSSLNEIIEKLGYEYQWKMIVDEYHAQFKMYQHNDTVSLKERNRWFSKDVAWSLAKQYVSLVSKRFDLLKEKHCKGIAYKTIGGKNVFVEDFHKHLHKAEELAKKIYNSENPRELYWNILSFDKLRFKMPHETTQSFEWVEAYKGAGAYFTMQNMIRFHNCFVYLNGSKLTKNQSIQYLNDKAVEFSDSRGWCMYGMLKQLIKDNNIDIEAKIASWRKR